MQNILTKREQKGNKKIYQQQEPTLATNINDKTFYQTKKCNQG